MGYSGRYIDETSIWSSIYVCEDCFNDYGLQEIVISLNEKGRCSYCEQQDKFVISMDLLVDYVIAAIKTEYDIPENGLAIDEGSFVEPPGGILYTNDILYEEDVCSNSAIIDDIHDILSDRWWVRKDFYGLDEHQDLKFNWDSFKDIVKHQNRFFFHRIETSVEYSRFVEPFQILGEISNFFNVENFIQHIPIGYEIFRARYMAKKDNFSSPEELGPPPIGKSKFPNRMSPAGISMFYGSENEDTALLEINANKGQYCIAKWKSIRELLVLDLIIHTHISNGIIYLNNYPSLFDENRNHHRYKYSFIINFIRDICATVNKDGLEHIEYIPTQVVSEYLRTIFRTNTGERLDGIRFVSSINGNNNLVLFESSIDCYSEGKNQILSLEDVMVKKIKGKFMRNIFRKFRKLLIKDVIGFSRSSLLVGNQ